MSRHTKASRREAFERYCYWAQEEHRPLPDVPSGPSVTLDLSDGAPPLPEQVAAQRAARRGAP